MDHDPMCFLNAEDYNTALVYMEQTGEQDIQRAIHILKKYSFDLQKAKKHELIDNQPEIPQEQQQQQALAHQYEEFLRRKQQPSYNIFTLFYYGVKYFLVALFKGAASLLLPNSLYIRIMYSRFYGLYYKQLHLPIQKKNLKDLLLTTRHHDHKSVLVAVSPNQGVDNALKGFLNKLEISESIAILFKFVGFTYGDQNLSLLEGIDNKPQLIICRMNILEEVVIIKRFFVQNFGDITPQKLKEGYNLGVDQMKKDKKVYRLFKRYRNFLKGNIVFTESSQQGEYDNSEREKVSHEIAVQNEVYQALEKEKQVEEDRKIRERERKEQEKELRKIRRQSIPEEPREGDFVRIQFRCPNGTNIARNFQSNEKVDLIYNWVEVNEEIEFQDENRRFQLMYSYPLKPLNQFKEKNIREIFQDSQEKVVIRQL